MQIPLILPPLQQHKLNVNLYYDPHARYGRPALCAAHGLHSRTDLGTTTVYGIHYNVALGLWIVVSGSNVYTFNGSSATSRGSRTTTSKVWMASNDAGDTIISDASAVSKLSSAYSLSTLSIPSGVPYAGPVCYQDKMLLIAKYGGDEFTPSDISSTDWDDYDPSYSSGQADTIVDMISLGRVVYVFGTQTVEAFYNSGDATAPFARIQGSMQHIGSAGLRCQAIVRGNIYMLTSNYKLVRITGTGGHEVVSTPLVERILESYFASQMWVFGVETNGWVCVSGDYGGTSATLVYDTQAAQTGLNAWFQWASGTTTLTKVPIYCSCSPPAGGSVDGLLGEITNGNLFVALSGTYTQSGSAFRTIWYIPPMREDRRQVFHHCLEVEHKEGTSTAGSQTVSLEYTDNREASTYQTTTAITLTGSDYDQLLRWWQLGVARERMYKVYCDAAIERAYFGANLIASVGSVAGTED